MELVEFFQSATDPYAQQSAHTLANATPGARVRERVICSVVFGYEVLAPPKPQTRRKKVQS